MPLSHTVRLGPILAIPQALRELGVNPARAFEAADVDPGIFDNPENRLPVESIGQLLQACADLTKCPHFGLLLGERFELHHFGLLGELLAHSTTVGDMLKHLLHHLSIQDRAAAPMLLQLDPERLILGYAVHRDGVAGMDQILDTSITVGFRVLASICGAEWSSLAIHFAHHPPKDITPYRRVFAAKIQFGSVISGIEFSSDWLERPIKGADKLHYAKAYKTLQASPLNSRKFIEQVKDALPQMLLSGVPLSPSIARHFAISERTLRRRLEAEDQSLHQLISNTRFELAKQLLRNTNLPITSIAKALQYQDPTAFSRAFRSWSTLSPAQWRNHQTRTLDSTEERA
ncbi:MAG: AraC family transcriptional regulator [Pseudomonadota bacterium]